MALPDENALTDDDLGVIRQAFKRVNETLPEQDRGIGAVKAAYQQIRHEQATIPTKREFTIEIITELITPVVVWATTQEEAEHLALEQFKLAAGDNQHETSESLARLWSVIGEGGSRLTRLEKSQVMSALVQIGFWWKSGTISSIFQDWDDTQIEPFAGTNPPSPEWDDFCDEIFGDIELSRADCWQAITEIAADQLASERGEQGDE